MILHEFLFYLNNSNLERWSDNWNFCYQKVLTEMETAEKFKVASNMVLISLLLGLSNIFIQGIEGAADIFLTLVILSFRYLVSNLIMRRFKWAKYLLIPLVARSLYRLASSDSSTTSSIFYYVFPVVSQLVLVVFAFILLQSLPRGISQKKNNS